ncbi:hypothetical protein CDL12_00641 [Handroanthus impetiginosus]|uniref:Uncharacterized protein n=1 Tax=Handroanthus impetiginosus TaxID=429701 RepID=A0A2G9IA37_9LAMI|nr:hypothetical protein CDL12_00641 [Handroanthus impetiginosus]
MDRNNWGGAQGVQIPGQANRWPNGGGCGYGRRRLLAESATSGFQTGDCKQDTGDANGGDWQEVTYQKIKSMNEMYFPELNEMYQRMAAKLQQQDAPPQQAKNEQSEKLRARKQIKK